MNSASQSPLGIENGRAPKNTELMLNRRATSTVVILSQLILAGVGHALHGWTCSEHRHTAGVGCGHEVAGDMIDGGLDHAHHGHTCCHTAADRDAVAAASQADQRDEHRLTAAGYSHSLHNSADCALCQTLKMSRTLAPATDVAVAVLPVTGGLLYDGPSPQQPSYRPDFARGPPVLAV